MRVAAVPERLPDDWAKQARSAHIAGEKVRCPRCGYPLVFEGDHEPGRIAGMIVRCEFCGLLGHADGRYTPD